MHSQTFMPLRTTVGPVIPLTDVQIVDHAPELAGLEMAVTTVGTPPTHYAKFQPDRLLRGSTGLAPGDGVATFPAPGQVPADLQTVMRRAFNLFDDFLRVMVVGPSVTATTQAKLWIELELTLSAKGGCPVLGGIVYGGYPHLPYYVTPYGANSANFGLPREIRVSWDGHMGEGFLDDEMAVVQQETTSHSGVHLLATGPVRTEKIRIRLADFPTILRSVGRTGGRQALREVWGILIPYLGVFAYQEDVRFAPPVAAGLLAAIQLPAQGDGGYLDPSQLSSTQAAQVAATAADQVYASTSPNQYFPLSAAALFTGGRSYLINIAGRQEQMPECFISGALGAGDQVRLYFAQSEEHRRCLGGLTLTGPEDKIVNWFTNESGGEFELAIYELDPVEGVSPLAPERDPSQDKYSLLLYRRRQLNFDDRTLKCAFVRPSTARNLVAVFTCTKPGRLALKALQLVQSAHVHVAPRPARSRRLRQMHFRLVGPHLAEDYARLGREGFKFSIEHVVSGEVKEVLFEARTLSDLLQLTGVRLYANQRYLETTTDVSQEVNETLPNSFEHRATQVGSHGWRRSQSGAGVSWTPVDTPVRLQQYTDNPGAGSFATRSNSETRSKTEHLGFLADATPLVNTLNVLESMLQLPPNTIVSAPPANALTLGTGWGAAAGQMWEGVPAGALGNINGLLNLSTPPISLPATVYQTLINIFSDPAGTAANLPTLIAGLPLSAFLLFNGVSFGINAGGSVGGSVGVTVSGNLGGSVSTSQLLPTVTRTSATGATGSISYQATRTGKSYAQSLNDGYDESESYTDYQGGVHRRKVTRNLFQPGTVRDRTAGVQFQWQEQVMDVVVGSVPLSLTLPALADKVYAQRDEWVRVRFGNGMRDGLRPLPAVVTHVPLQCNGATDLVMDVWFDLKEEVVRDDY
jgi:hypothetical protein